MSVLGRKPGAASPPRKGDSADLQWFENENQIMPEASLLAHLPIEPAPQTARHITAEPTLAGSSLVKPSSAVL